MNNEKSYGKVRYIEPNDILENNLYDKGNKGSFNITHPYEDYSISVDLIVKIPNRNGVATNNSGTHIIPLTSNDIDNGNMSFFSGTDGYLTDEPNMTIYKDILDGKSTQESLGISNIHVSYNSYFYPEVTIKFVDVRGSALMMTHEENYIREKRGIQDKVNNFFTSLFSFPSPEFKLRIKGFYGKKVEYSLLVSDFRSSFNNQTGNFDATVKFIGKMYGVYTDIPMTYLLISPYCKYGGSGDLTIWQRHNFKFDDGTPMPTFLELKDKIITANHELKSHVSQETIDKYGKTNKKQKMLQDISDEFSKLKVILSHEKNIIIADNVILCKEENGKCEYLYATSANELFTTTQRLYGLIKNFNDETGENIPQLSTFNNADKKFGEGSDKINVSVKEGKVTINCNNVKSFTLSKCLNLEYYINSYMLKNNHKFDSVDFFVISGVDMVDRLNTLISTTKKEVEDVHNEATDESNLVVSEIIGFDPSIKNVFKILMAHLQTFVEIYASLLKNITGTNARTLDKHGLTMHNTADIPNSSKNLNELIIPPFPAIKDKNNNEYCYPSSYIVNGVMQETIFIDSLFDSTYDFVKKLEESNKLSEEYLDESVHLIPTCLTDIINIINPYDKLLNNSDSTIGIDWIFTYFGWRCVSKLMLEQREVLSPEEFGKCEAYNFWRVNRNLKKSVIDGIKSNTCDSARFIDFLLGGKNGNNPYINGNSPCYTTNESTKQLLFKIDIKGDANGKIRTSGLFHTPSVIGRNGGNFSTFYGDAEDYHGIYSFINGNTKENRPYEFIRFVKKSTLEEWSSKLSALDLSDYCSNETKSNLLEIYLKPQKGSFKNGLVTYRTSNVEKFYQGYTDMNSYKTNWKNISLSENYDNEFSTGTLDCIHTNENTPIFFYEGLTPEIFLMSIPHNLDILSESLKNGKCIATIPYCTKLFLGMMLSKLKNNSLKDIVDFVKTKLMIINGINDNDEIKTYLKNIYTILSCFTRSSDGRYNENACDIIDNKNIKNTLKLFYNPDENTLKDYYYNDYLDLILTYNTWCTSRSEGGFEFFKESYCLVENDTDKDFIKNESNKWSLIFNGKVYNGNGETITDRLIYVCKHNMSKETNTNEIRKILNKCYKSISESHKTGEPFSDRYSSVHFIDKKIIHLTFNENFSAYNSLNEFFKKTEKIVIPYQMKPYDSYKTNQTKETRPNINNSVLVSAFNAFKKQVIELYKNFDSETGKEKNQSIEKYTAQAVNEDTKLSMYRTLKNLYDKHFSDLIDKEKIYDVNEPDSEFKRFHFIDTFYTDLGDKFKFNLSSMIEILTSIMNGYSSGDIDGSVKSELSVYSFMSLLCQKHGMMLLAMPFFNGSFTQKEGGKNLSDMFKPQPYNKSLNETSLNGPSYVCFYSHQPSQHLDNPNSQYSNDGFDISDINGSDEFTGPLQIPDLQTLGEDDYIIPAFGVEYGSQKQSIFKSVNVNMDNPQITEVSVANQFALANTNNEDMKKLSFNGQDLYKIYSNYSYTCQVEMMGCAQIQPLMYFQLNNIPMFRGAYQIIQVEHDITPGNMTTSFKGVRINRTKVPMVKTCLSAIDMERILNNESELDKPKYNKPMNIQDIPLADTNLPFMNGDFDVTANTIKSEYPEYIIFREGQEESFNRLNPALRKLMYCITGDMKELSKKLNYRLGIYISSSTRDSVVNGNNSSDHIINGTPSERRRNLKGKDVYGVEKLYSEMGCAVDFYGTKNGNIDKGEASINLFSHIANNYYEYIRQLIWEVKDQSTTQNNITLIHLASYGRVGPNGSDKCQIYLAEYPKYSGVSTGDKRLSSEFLRILMNMSKNNKLKNVYLNNFTSDNGKPTTEVLTKKYENAIS